MKTYWNYWIAMAVCLMGTVMAALTADKDVYWLMVSDGNVAITLFIAAILDWRR